ncbi:MAG: GNAT family N-acetyltransferase [Chloroflexota bacterium]
MANQETDWISVSVGGLALCWSEFAHAVGGRNEDWPLAWVADGASPNPFLNAATLKRPLADGDAAELTAELESFFGARAGGPWLLWSGWPTPDLRAHGYVLWGHPPVLVRPAGGEAPPSPAELRIVESRDASTIADVERVLVDGYPVLGVEGLLPGGVVPPAILGGSVRLWVGYVDDRPVSVAAVVLDGKVNHVCLVATLPDARRKGYGRALTWQATLADPRLPALLESSADGYPLYAEMGYEVVGQLSLWERPRDMRNPVYSPYAPVGKATGG